MQYKLGKLAAKHDDRTLKFKSYFKSLPPIPQSIDWTAGITNFLMCGNDTVGDCTCAGAAHLEMIWESNAKTSTVPTTEEPLTSQVLAAYSAITGYNPSDPNTDTGADLLTVLNYWTNNPIANYNIKAYTQLPLNNLNDIRAAIALFGGVYMGVQLPDDAQTAFSNGQPWIDTTDNNIEGGHCIVLVGYTPQYFTAISWGAKQLLSPDWFTKYADEAYAVISPQWINAYGTAPSGFNLAQLEADLQAL